MAHADRAASPSGRPICTGKSLPETLLLGSVVLPNAVSEGQEAAVELLPVLGALRIAVPARHSALCFTSSLPSKLQEESVVLGCGTLKSSCTTLPNLSSECYADGVSSDSLEIGQHSGHFK